MTEEENQQNTENSQDNNLELTVQDLDSIRQVIDISCQRGTFRPTEMKSVGEIYEKLQNFLTAVQQQQNSPGE